MQRFYYFLEDSPNYANDIMADSKQEVQNLLMESLASSTSITRILTEEEYLGKKSNSDTKAIYADASEYKSGNDFLNEVIKSASICAKENETNIQKKQKVEQNSNNIRTVTISKQIPQQHVDGVKYFEEAGIQFKLENGKLYKKVWQDISNDSNVEFRIISIKNNKEADKSKFKLEKLNWVEL